MLEINSKTKYSLTSKTQFDWIIKLLKINTILQLWTEDLKDIIYIYIYLSMLPWLKPMCVNNEEFWSSKHQQKN